MHPIGWPRGVLWMERKRLTVCRARGPMHRYQVRSWEASSRDEAKDT